MLSKEDILEALRTVDDPELGINVVDLGLIYKVEIDEENNVDITMTLTTMGCPLHESLNRGIQQAVAVLPEADNVQVHLVWFPEWTPEKMSDAAKEMLWRR